ncbi:lipase family protein [Mesorhizobium sp. BAC0120]|uniref:lipase family protein n=1 Tax=Mesorhizobium sp. BAC0120 TaxID=3090670 RepID=UPI00298D2214|nr:lipase family protein [Mesorhizobium sp. BAC0120]MDW6024247.1 lipase family protein [Mesorhizobium sp. BAC0120]
MALTCASLLTSCAGPPSALILSLGSKIVPHKVDFEEIYAFAERSNAAYASKEKIKSKYPFTVRIDSPGQTSVLYFLERNDAARTQFITVRGTADKTNLFEDIDLAERRDRKINIPVHAGFDRIARAIYTDVKPYLRTGYKTYVTGHSLGGAVAALLSIYLIEDGVAVKRVVTFGQPRFTTAAGVRKLGLLPLTRVVDENDVVPMLPPSFIPDEIYGPYDHTGPEVILLQAQDFVWLPIHDATRIALGAFWRSISFADLKDHHMYNYLRRIADKTKGAIEVAYDEREKFVFPTSEDE